MSDGSKRHTHQTERQVCSRNGKHSYLPRMHTPMETATDQRTAVASDVAAAACRLVARHWTVRVIARDKGKPTLVGWTGWVLMMTDTAAWAPHTRSAHTTHQHFHFLSATLPLFTWSVNTTYPLWFTLPLLILNIRTCYQTQMLSRSLLELFFSTPPQPPPLSHGSLSPMGFQLNWTVETTIHWRSTIALHPLVSHFVSWYHFKLPPPPLLLVFCTSR